MRLDGDHAVTALGITWARQHVLKSELSKAEDAHAWRIGGRYTTVRVGSGPSARVYREAFEPPPMLHRILSDMADAGLELDVSSWGGIWRQWRVFPPPIPRVPGALLSDTRPVSPYPWIEQRGPIGRQPGSWSEWDIRSAYAWASTLGLPDLRTVQRVRKNSPISDDGAYLVSGVVSVTGEPEPPTLPTWLRPRPRLPIRSNLFGRSRRTRAFWVPGETLNRLMLRPESVHAAVEWRRRMDLRRVFDDIRERLPEWWRCVYRAHWGDWGSDTACLHELWSGGKLRKSIPMPQGLRAPLWSWAVQTRVCDRVSALAEHAARIFIDAATVPSRWTPPNVGEEVGQWKRKIVHRNGVDIRPLPWRPV